MRLSCLRSLGSCIIRWTILWAWRGILTDVTILTCKLRSEQYLNMRLEKNSLNKLGFAPWPPEDCILHINAYTHFLLLASSECIKNVVKNKIKLWKIISWRKNITFIWAKNWLPFHCCVATTQKTKMHDYSCVPCVPCFPDHLKKTFMNSLIVNWRFSVMRE